MKQILLLITLSFMLVQLSGCNDKPDTPQTGGGNPDSPTQSSPTTQKPQRLNGVQVRAMIENMDANLLSTLKQRANADPNFFTNLCERSEFFNISLSPEGALEAYEILKAK